ncbi:MAG TPA: GNAT family N-acetyltransferase [Rhizomicrobium sp.]|jgi:GNAT superfamily N-acetyltransferase|nr:GNAT family N-acetyltransferase [Rhizomicrobium sp.]
MADALNITIEPPDEVVTGQIHASLGAFNRAAVDRSAREFFNVALRDAEGRLQGALMASIRFDVLNIQDLFIAEPHRRGGNGARLIAVAETEARKRGARLACVMTFSWQARPFYEKQGYEVFGELPYQAGAHTLYWLKKSLCA